MIEEERKKIVKFVLDLQKDIEWAREECADGAHFREQMETLSDNIDIFLKDNKLDKVVKNDI